MKYGDFSRFILVSIFIFMAASCSKKSAENPKELGREVLGFLKNNDREGFIKYVSPSEQEYEEFFGKVIKARYEENTGIKYENAPTHEKLIIDNTIEEVFSTIPKKLQDIGLSFDFVRKRGEGAGIDWQKVKYKESIYHVTKEYGFSQTSISVHYEYSGKLYDLTLRSCVKLENKWKLFDSMSFVGEFTR